MKPILIAICGYPGAGKSETQRLLDEVFGVTPVDDGWPLRRFAMDYFGATALDVVTQEGKRRTTTICGNTWEWRKVLGELGNALENKFGEHVIPEIVVNGVLRVQPPDMAYSFASVRKTQGEYYRSLGGIVLEVYNPSVKPTGNAFDEYSREAVTHSLINHGVDLNALRREVMTFGTNIGLKPAKLIAA